MHTSGTVPHHSSNREKKTVDFGNLQVSETRIPRFVSLISLVYRGRRSVPKETSNRYIDFIILFFKLMKMSIVIYDLCRSFDRTHDMLMF